MINQKWEDHELAKYLAVCKDAAHAAGNVLKDFIGRIHVREKGRADLVTEADVAAQEKVKEVVSRAFPDHVFLGEEDTPCSDSERAREGVFRWIVDPLDGTTNYVHGVPFFGVSLALECGGELLVSAIYAPLLGEFFSAAKGHGAFLNENPLSVSRTREVQQSVIAVGFPPVIRYDAPGLLAFLNCLCECQAVRRTGSTALNMAYVAAGRFDACWNFSTKPWDMAAGALLVQEAGGTLTTITGDDFFIDQNTFLVAATPELHKDFRELIHSQQFIHWMEENGSRLR
ncbi:MAG: inositol monophosphatase family protein [Planctomycetia bacterium]|nr:inositol monophosphatase family protein [Planctomycetia bacterium]